ncbi:MAG: NADP-dependent oxidoreductase [Pseudomonadota bacterium]|nr:NADP-dependent oxidoreductase [Pseudomonadota bacterium]
MVINNFGGIEAFKLEKMPIPEPGEGEVLVEIFAIGINPIDIKTRRGEGVARLWENPAFPIILGWDISGVVVKSNSPKFTVGDEVFGMPNFPELANGYSEFIAVPAKDLSPKPNQISHQAAAAAPLAGLTAWQGLFDFAKLQTGQKVLIHAGAGGVGHLAIQLSKWKGAHVISTASTGNLEFLGNLGADSSIDYTQTKFWELARDIDIVFHMIEPEYFQKSCHTMKPGGYIISITGAVAAKDLAPHNVRGSFLSVRPNSEQLSNIAELLVSGQILTHIDASYSLGEISKAHDHVESGHTRGKVILDLGL